MPGLKALRGGAGQRGVAVHAERVVVLVALLASPAGAAAEKVSAICRARAKVCNEKFVCVRERERERATKCGEIRRTFHSILRYGDKTVSDQATLVANSVCVCACVCVLCS